MYFYMYFYMYFRKKDGEPAYRRIAPEMTICCTWLVPS